MRKTAVGVVVLALCCLLPGALGEESADYRRARQAVVEQFEASAPAVGEPLPEVTLVDADGRVHNLRDLVGEHYTVLVLGCLT